MANSPIFLTAIQNLAKSYGDQNLTNLADSFNDSLGGKFTLDVSQGGWNNPQQLTRFSAFSTITAALQASLLTSSGVSKTPNRARVYNLIIEMVETNGVATDSKLTVEFRTPFKNLAGSPNNTRVIVYEEALTFAANETKRFQFASLRNMYVPNNTEIVCLIEKSAPASEIEIQSDLDLLFNDTSLIVQNVV